MACLTLRLVALSLLARAALCAYEPVYPAAAAVRYNGSQSSRFPDNDIVVETDLEYFISELNFEAVAGKIVTGAADKLYRLNSNLTLDQQYDWTSSATNLAQCATVNTGSVQDFTCRNHLRVYSTLPEDTSRLMVCGTLAGDDPQCRTVSTADLTASPSPAISASNGLVSYYPEYPGFGQFRAQGSSPSDMTYFSAGYFANPAGGSGRRFNITFHSVAYDTGNNAVTTTPTLKLKNDDTWINAPVTFVDYYRGDYAVMSPATLPEHYQFYFVFFREALVNSDSNLNIVYSRVARICRNDPGINGEFTTYMKARIFCEREVPPGREFTGTSDFQYNEIRSVAFNSDGRYYENGDWGRLMYGAFSGPSIGPKGTAICVYTAGNNGFSSGIFDIFREDIQRIDPVTGATAEIQNSFLECQAAGRSAANAEFIQIVRDVKQIGEDPILVFDGFYVTHMIVDRVCVVRRDEEQCRNQDVIFLGTDDGRVLKVVLASLDENDNSENTEPVISEEIQLDDSRAINKMRIEADDGGAPFLYVSTDSKLYRFPLQRCSRHEGCRECIQARDPYCVWNTATNLCEANTLTANAEVTSAIPTNIKQDIHLGSIPECAAVPDCSLTCSAVSSSVVEVTATCSSTAQVEFSTSVAGATATTCSSSPSPLAYPPRVNLDPQNTACVRLSGGQGLQVHELATTAFLTSGSSAGTVFSCGPVTTQPGAPLVPSPGDVLSQTTPTSFTVNLAVPQFTDYFDQYSFLVSYDTSDNPSMVLMTPPFSFNSSEAPQSIPITGLAPASTVVYRVQVINSVSSVTSAPLTLTLPEAPPGTVTNLLSTSTPPTASTISLQWSPPTVTNGVIDGYVVRIDGDPVIGCSELTATGYTATGLTPFTEYELSVAACTNAGEGSFESTTVRTPCGTPSAVRNPTFSATQAYSLTLSWEAPEFINGDASRLMYQVRWTCHFAFGSVSSREITSTISATSQTTPVDLGLRPLTLCSVNVFAINMCLGQSSVDGIPVELYERSANTTPGLVSNLVATPLSPTSMLVTWEPPVDFPNQPLQYDLLVLVNEDDPQVLGENRFIETYVNKYVTGLQPNTQYRVSVSANDSQADLISATTLPALPSPPSDVTLDVINGNIRASWSDVDAVTSYRVLWRCNDVTGEATVTGGTPSYDIIINSPSANFAFCAVQVQSNNALGQSTLSPIATVVVPARVPGQPRCFFNDNRGSTVSISFDITDPFSTNSYSVEYTYTSDQGVTRAGTEYYSGANFTSNVLDIGVDRNTQYEFQLRMCNEHGCGDYCETLSVNTSSISPRPPSEVSSRAVTFSSANITWSLPDGEDPTTITYNVQLTSSCPTTINFIPGLDRRWYYTDDLCAETNYTVAVQVTTVVNGTMLTGMYGPHHDFITLSGAPSPVRDVNARYSVTLQELKVTWGSPKEPNGTLRYYEINWSDSTIGKTCENPDGLVLSSVVMEIDALEFTTTNTGNINTSKTLLVCVRAFTRFPGQWGMYFTSDFSAGALTNTAQLDDCNGLIAVAVIAGFAIIAAVVMSILLAVVICKYGWTPCAKEKERSGSEEDFKDQPPVYHKSQSIQSTSSNIGLVQGRSNGYNKKRKR